MSISVPPSVFFGKRTTRAQTKVEPGRGAEFANTLTTKVSKTQTNEVASQRQLRSVTQSSKKASGPATSSAVPSSSSQRNLRARKNATSENPQQNSTQVTAKSVKSQNSSIGRPDPNNFETSHHEKNPIYKQAIVGSSFVKDPAEDEYEFHVETPEGTRKKPKRRQPRVKKKTQTLWGLTVKREIKQKCKPCKKVFIQELENVRQVQKTIQPAIVSKDVQPNVKKTPPLQERAVNMLNTTIAPSVGGCILENPKKDNVISLLSDKRNTDKSTSKSSLNCVNPMNKQTLEEAKENNPLGKKKSLDAAIAKVFQTPFKKKHLALHSNCAPAQSPQCPPTFNSSPVKNTGLSPPAITNMSVILSPIHGSAKPAFQSLDQSQNRKSIHASTPVHSKGLRNHKEAADANISLQEGNSPCSRQDVPTAISIPCEDFAQSISNQQDYSARPPQDSEDHDSSNTGSDFDNSQDLFNPDILQDVHNGAKPSIPARMLGGRKPTIFRGSKVPPLNRFTRHGTEHLVPVGITDSCWRVGPTIKYVYPYEPTFDDCFGFDNGPDAYPIDTYSVKHHVPQKKLVIHPERLACPQPEEQLCPQPEKQSCPGTTKKPCSHPQKKADPPPEKHCLRSQMKLGSMSEELGSPHSGNTTSLLDAKIDEMLSSSLSRLRKKKRSVNDTTIFDSITSNEDSEPSSTSQQTEVMEDSITTAKQPFSLFEDQEDNIYKSPFTQPSRRTYTHLRRLKRFVDEDDDNEEEEEEYRTKTSKPNKTVYKRRKMVQTTLLDKWAKDLSSHFAEVDDTELITE